MNGKRSSKALFGLALITIVLILSACASGTAEPSAQNHAEAQTNADRPAAAPGDGAAADGLDEVAEPASEEMAGEAAPLPAASMPPAEVEERAAAGMVEAEAVAEGYGGGDDMALAGDSAEPGRGYVPPDEQFVPLQAGEINDNQDFVEYLDYRSNFHQRLGYTVNDRDISERHVIRVTNGNGLPVLGAEVLIYDGRSLVTALRTTATGSVYFFPMVYSQHAGAQSFEVTVQKGQNRETFTLSRQRRDATWPVTLNARSAQPPVKLDVLFLLDATGSMSDEIDQLKDNILSMSAQIEALPSRPDVRFGLVHYRDRGDAYVTRVSDFTGDVSAFQRDLMGVSANGGGDTPESLNEALHRAVWDVSWRVEDTVSLIFLVADAPPHLDYAQDYDYAEDMQAAAELGIKIFPIGSRLDGFDPDQKVAEYVFRQLAQYTGGNFIFLTYRDTPQSSGAPGTEYTIEEGSYSVEDLDALVVRLVEEELAALSGGQP